MAVNGRNEFQEEKRVTTHPRKTFRALAATLAIATLLAFTPLVAAQLASRPADDWVKTLESPERLAGLKIDEVVARLNLKPGEVVADLGAGSGPFEVALARAVSPRGRVYAVDIDGGFFPYIQRKAADAKVTNVQTVLGQPTDPKLPASDVDVAMFHDVLHHIQDRPAYLANLVRYLKPTARIAIIEFNPAQSPHKDDATLVVSREQASEWLTRSGFAHSTNVSLFPDKWFVVYSR